MRDFHVHSTYSDGAFLGEMIGAAESAGLEAIGFADHCTVSEREYPRSMRETYGFTLDLTYERRRRGIERLRETTDIAVYDAVEVDYHPADEAAVAAFLEAADFEYAIGSVHEIDGQNVQEPARFEGKSDARLDDLVEEYVESLVALIDSELFDVAAHVDLFERTPALRGRATDEHYRRIAEAFETSRTVPEVNAGRALREMEVVHPGPRFLEVLLDHDVRFTIGSDSHAPGEVVDRAPFLRKFVDEHLGRVVAPPGLEGVR